MESDNCTRFVKAITKIICKTREIKDNLINPTMYTDASKKSRVIDQ